MTDQEKLGMFSWAGSINVGDEYEQKHPIKSRYTGKQMLTKGDTWGNNPDALLDKTFKRLSENDTYLDPGTLERKERVKKREKNITEKAFYPTAPAKKSTGPGMNYGTIGEPMPYKHEFEPNELKSMILKPEVGEPKNFQTAARKMGGYGTLGTTIGPAHEYLSEPYCYSRTLERTERAVNREKIAKPFVSSGRGGGLFDRNVYATEPGPQFRPRDRPRPIEKPFKPPHPPKTGVNCTISQFPEYMEDPLEIKLKKDREEKAAARPPGIFKPMNVSKTMRVTAVNPYETAARPSKDEYMF
mmetsp:Transcript_11368/g.13476  ORF Transcript_11368/g.13476 Transcript_11368/m.13476 type:complete len:300 (+) Transcript_11368:134-1033(+)|eukprot:CAMPEP_0197867216 /NCGR_PEP_ID=MMETSP1438-20131217/44637_1 /TAXON_ID=1461541 /ORGANISM="Pterosperma sp., Strain CCMP1384" /LENGTH=299 /DNA_ID=CAMNT_0043485849 /DNA_START=124 /DNA_END=1023 /DNA_ORIENTATION=-